MDILELGGEGLGSLQGRLCVPRKEKVEPASFAFSPPSCRALCRSLLFQRLSERGMEESLWAVLSHRKGFLASGQL